MEETKVDGVTTEHPDYIARKDQWETMRDCMEGADRIKEKGERYLPAASSAHKNMDEYEMRRYNNYKFRADYTNYVAQIHDCLHGLAENRPAKIDVPLKLKEKGILTNIDYQGNSADQFFSDCLDDVLVTGFGGILVDMPKVDPNMSEKSAEDLQVRPYLTYYRAESIINWKYTLVDGIKKLTLVVLKEEVEAPDSIFSHKTVTQYRVIRIDGKICVQEVYTITKDEYGKTKQTRSDKIPVTVKDKPINYIPFIMLPFNKPVKPILYDIALLNIGHYQKSADYVNGVHLTTIPTGYVTGWTANEDPTTKEPTPIYLGADTFIQIGEEKAKIGNLTFAGEGLVHCEQALDRAEAQIITLGSHIISAEKKTAENKDALSIHRQGEDAKLATYVRYMSKRFTDALKIICSWLELDDEDVLVELNTDYSSMAFDANAINSIANIFSQGKLPLRSLYYMLSQGGYLDPEMTYEGFVYLLDLENAAIPPTEVEEAYLKFKRTGKKIEYEKSDWYSPSKLTETVQNVNGEDNDKTDEQ